MEETTAASGGPLAELPKEAAKLLHDLSTLNVNGHEYAQGQFVLTNYVFFLFIAIAFLGIVLFIAVRGLSLVPKNKLSNAVEALGEFVRNDIAVAMIGHDGAKYFPFLATVFFFVLANNLVGLIPGCKPGTGTMGVTVALSTTVFLFFNAVGFKNQGAWGYIKSFSPKGVPFPINLIVWLIEVFSAFLRVFTLAVRLFANMYAGHIILGIFAILTALFTEPLIAAIQHGGNIAGAAVGALPAIGWILLMTALYLLEVLVAFVQAYVFTILSAVYIGAAAHEH
ncbi:MAG TPA: F0F1 ATP synthase subunit A [Coriobacteriia bacterium]